MSKSKNKEVILRYTTIFALAALSMNLTAASFCQVISAPNAPTDSASSISQKHGPAKEVDRAITVNSTMDRAFQQLGSDFVKEDRSDGLSIAVVAEGKVRFYNFGSISRGNPQPPTENTVYEIGSITKLSTSLLLAHAVSDGKVSLQDDVRKYLPGDYPNLSFEGRPVRLIDLADTTSALPENFGDLAKITQNAGPDEVPFRVIEEWRKYTDADLIEDLKSVTLLGRPGDMPRHTNVAPALLAHILENVYGKSYEYLLARYVEEPFGMMTGTGHSREALLATGYSERHALMPSIDVRSILPAGGLRYSASDMARFLKGELAASNSAIRLSQKPAWGTPDKTAVGFNWILTRTIDDKLRLQTSGGTFGFSSYIEMYPDQNYGVVLLANRSGDAQDQLQRLADKALEAVAGEPYVETALSDALNHDNYRNVGLIIAGVRRDHPELHLTEQYINQWAYRLLAANSPEHAIALFKFNVEEWPQSWNAFDSLGECYERLGDTQRAVVSYQRSLELNPKNNHAADRLKSFSLTSTQ